MRVPCSSEIATYEALFPCFIVPNGVRGSLLRETECRDCVMTKALGAKLFRVRHWSIENDTDLYIYYSIMRQAVAATSKVVLDERNLKQCTGRQSREMTSYTKQGSAQDSTSKLLLMKLPRHMSSFAITSLLLIGGSPNALQYPPVQPIVTPGLDGKKPQHPDELIVGMNKCHLNNLQ
jgi:hypothetical protein